ncbi:hypothetical protein AB3R30_16305 [Leptolyngbyaceae cyanobacterium UHCC 1019]
MTLGENSDRPYPSHRPFPKKRSLLPKSRSPSPKQNEIAPLP